MVVVVGWKGCCGGRKVTVVVIVKVELEGWK